LYWFAVGSLQSAVQNLRFTLTGSRILNSGFWPSKTLNSYRQLTPLADLLGLKNLQEAMQRKMASMYKEVCETEEFLSQINADQLTNLLSRDDLSAPSESFVFKSVMHWIKYKKEERMAVAAKVIGTVSLGLVDIKEVIAELNTEEMQRVPEIQALVS